MARVSRARDGFAIRGIAPPELRGRSDEHKRVFWSFALAAALEVKDRELARGLDKDGGKLRRIKAATRAHRRSAMTPTGRGDPSAPPLMPGRALSRTRSLLTGKAFADHCELYWRYDPFTYDSWARILRFQARRGRDVFGLSPGGMKTVTARSWADYRRWAKGRAIPVPRPPAPAMAPPPGEVVSPGGMPWERWLAYLRRPAPPPEAPARGRPWSRLLRFIFGS